MIINMDLYFNKFVLHSKFMTIYNDYNRFHYCNFYLVIFIHKTILLRKLDYVSKRYKKRLIENYITNENFIK